MKNYGLKLAPIAVSYRVARKAGIRLKISLKDGLLPNDGFDYLFAVDEDQRIDEDNAENARND